MKNESFPKSEKLVSLKLINRLFSGGDSKSLSAFPLRLVYLLLDEDDDSLHVNGRTTPMSNTQVLISVPKRNFRHAVDRNRVKRQVREAYRRHRDLYALPEGKYLAMAFIWTDHRHHESQDVEMKVTNLLRRMGEKLC